MTQYPAKTRLFSCFLAINCLTCALPRQLLAETFTYPEQEFRIEVPKGFEAKKDPAPGVNVLIFNKTLNFPTFNVITRPGSYLTTSLTDKTQTQQIVDSYKEVGISDASPISSHSSNIGSRGIFSVEITYKSLGKDMISSANIVSGKQKHYILTFIDTKETFLANKNILDGLLGSFSSWETAEEATPAVESQSLRLSNSALVMSAILASLVAIWLLAKIRRSAKH